MNKKIQTIFWSLTGLAFLALVNDATAAKSLSAAQIKAFFKGAFVGEYGKQKIPFIVRASTSGKLRAQAEGKFDSGRWRIKGNQLCVTWQHWNADQEKCLHIVRRRGWYAALKSSGKILLRFRRK